MDDAEVTASWLRGASCILLDFDGPVCDLFAGFSPADVTRWIRERSAEALPGSDDPLDLLEFVAEHLPAQQVRVEQLLAEAELMCARSAVPTPGARDFLEKCAATGRPVVIVSNNSGPAIRSYLAREGLEPFVMAVAGRDPADVALMKPDPFLVREGLNRATCWPGDALMIGDSVSDLEAAAAASVVSIGVVNKPGRLEQLAAALPKALVTSMTFLATAL